MARTLNLGILAHIDAGKTTLTERILHAVGITDEVGSVDAGNSQTDTLTLERRRGITIQSAVVSFDLDGVTVNLVDTPGHPEFIAEVERVLSALDGAVLVVSAVEGVQAQTRVLMRTLQRLRIPTLIFVNKIDRRGAELDRVLRDLSRRLSITVLPMGSARNPGTSEARFLPYDPADRGCADRLTELLAEQDEKLLAAYVDEAPVPYARLRRALAAQTGATLVHPVYAGSAITGAGIDALLSGVAELLPASDNDPDGPVSGSVFKVERGRAGELIAYVRLVTGTVRVRERIPFGTDREGKVTAIHVFEHGSTVERSSVVAGRIAKLWGLPGVRIGDTIGPTHSSADEHYFAPPTLETVVDPAHRNDKGGLYVALGRLAEQDPLINLRQDDVRQELSVSLYGEVQKEVIQATLESEFGIDVTFRDTTTLCIERPIGTGASAEFMGEAANPFKATVGLRLDPGPVGSGVRFRLEVELGSLPLSFVRAIEETVHQTLREGLRGWPATDCTVSLTHSGYVPPPPTGWSSASSSAGDFRHLTPLVVMDALQEAGTAVCEPIHGFDLEIPADTLGSVLAALSRLRGVPATPVGHGESYAVTGMIPAARVHALRQQLPELCRGDGVLESWFDHYQPVAATPPFRARTDLNPLNREEYLVHILRGV